MNTAFLFFHTLILFEFPPGTSYFLLLALSERTSFVGGEILVNKRKQQLNNPGLTAISNEEGNEENEDEEEDVQKRDEALVQSEIDKKMIKYNKLSRFTPDKSSIVVVEGRSIVF